MAVVIVTSIATQLHLRAQGCRFGYPGYQNRMADSTATGSVRRNPFRVDKDLHLLAQG